MCLVARKHQRRLIVVFARVLSEGVRWCGWRGHDVVDRKFISNFAFAKGSGFGLYKFDFLVLLVTKKHNDGLDRTCHVM